MRPDTVVKAAASSRTAGAAAACRLLPEGRGTTKAPTRSHATAHGGVFRYRDRWVSQCVGARHRGIDR